jgi:tetratricopeptide (TPR) repeat protein
VALFITRAHAVKADFSLTPDNAADVAAICRRLDGLPLALELAAARINLLSPSFLLARLDKGLKVLSAGRRDASDRQRTLRGAIAWSYELLSEDEQSLFRRLAVFAGGWSLEAAESVCDRGDLELDVLDGLASLADKSLVRASAADADRFTMLETIREFALEKLEESGEAEDIRRAHAEYFRQFGRGAELGLRSVNQLSWLRRLEGDQDNFRAVLDWSLSNEPSLALEIGAGLWRFWAARSLSEGREWLARGLEADQGSPRLRARALTGAGSIAHLQGDLESAISLNQTGLNLFEQLDDQGGMSGALTDLAFIANLRHDLHSARALSERSVTAARASDDDWVLLRAINTLGTIAAEEGAIDDATSLYREAVKLSEKLGDERGRAMVLLNLGDLALERGNLSEASEALIESLELSRMLNVQTLEATALLNLGMLALRQVDLPRSRELIRESLAVASSSGSDFLLVSGFELLALVLSAEGDHYRATRLLGAAEQWREDFKIPRSNSEALLIQESSDKAIAVLGEEVWIEAFEGGRKASTKYVTEEALNSLSQVKRNV